MSIAWIRIEQLNLNDEYVKLVKWFIKSGDMVSQDQLICSVETTKCVNEIFAPRAGIIHVLIGEEGSMVKVGSEIGLIADTMADIEANLKPSTAKTARGPETTDAKVRCTPKAQALAEAHGIDLAEVMRMGVVGTIKEVDIEKFLSIPKSLRTYVNDEGVLPEYAQGVARKLKANLNATLPLTMEAVFDLTTVNQYIGQAKDTGITISLLHIILAALPKTLEEHQVFKKFQVNQRLFSYKETKVAFIVRTIDDKLSMPVISGLAQMTMEEIVENTQALALEANRGQLKASQSMGACLSISYISNPWISRFEALMDSYQSAILAVAVSGSTATLTLSYDHTLIDGWMAAAFLADLIQEMKEVIACPFKTK